MTKYCLVFIGCIFLIQSLHGQKPTFRFKNLSTVQGLSINNATCILQDSKGFIWVGTRDGLNKYDGYTFIIYRSDPQDSTSLSGNFILDIKEDKQGDLWITTYEGGLNQYRSKDDKFIRYTHNPHDPNSLSHNMVRTVLVDKDENVWVGTKGGLDRLDKKANHFIHYRHNSNNPASLADNEINRLFEDRKGHLWVGTYKGGLDRFDWKSNIFTHYRHDSANYRSISENNILSIYEDRQENLWVGTDANGLNLLDRKTNTFTRFHHNPDNPNSLSNNTIRCIQEDEKGYLWLGTENGGINLYDKKKHLFYRYNQDDNEPFGISANSFWEIYKDKKGNLWLATYGGGVDFLDKEPVKFVHYKKEPNNPNSLFHNNVDAFYEDDKGHIWIGTDGGGLSVFDREHNAFRHYRHQPIPTSLASDVVLTIKQGRDKEFFLGTFRGGLSRSKNAETGEFYTFPVDTIGNQGTSNDIIGSLVEDKQGNWWVGTWQGGLNYYDRTKNTFTHYKPNPNDPQSISSVEVWSLFQDSQENLWIGTLGGGLDLLDKATKRFIHYKHEKKNPTSISNDIINTIFEDLKGNLWLGTNNGLNLFHPATQTFSHYFQKDGLPNNAIQSILEDGQGNLWLGTNNGLSRFNPSAKTFRNYKLNDGLQGSDFNPEACLKTAKGEMFFGGSKGFNVFHPDSIRENTFLPPVFITDLQIFNKSVSVGGKDSPLKTHINEVKELRLSYKQSVFSFEFAALNYTIPEKNQYAFKLEGFDKEWNYVGTQRKATYTNLDPGDYTFRVKASNNDGVWNEKGTSIQIIITPPYWATWWFRTFVSLIIVGAVYSFIKNKINSIKRQRTKLEEQVRQRTAEVVEQQHELQGQAENLQTLNEQLQSQTDFLGNINGELKQQKEELQQQKIENIAKREDAEKARREAERANQAKSIFLATMSHEIRTPMNGVLGMASLLAETALTIEQQDYTDTIRSSGDALLTVINDILDFSKIESGNLELDSNDFDMRQCLEEVMDVFSAKASQKGLDLVYQIDYKIPPQIIGDGHRLRQILINLISNAMKFTHRGEIFVEIELQDRDNDQLNLAFHVRDTGIGIPQDKISRLFKAFSQVDTSTTRKYGGTGLGLVISQRLVELMGGCITVESQEGLGTTFNFTIKTKVSQEPIRQYVHYNMVDNEGKRVLLVDDNVTNLKILKTQLEQWNLSPTLAFTGKEALEILASPEARFDLVITDMQMPDMDGTQLSQHIKARSARLPIILLSSVGYENKRKYPELFAAILNKPAKQQQLSQVIQAALRSDGTAIAVVAQKSKQVLSEEFAEKYPLQILIAEDNPVNQKLALRVLAKLGYKTIDIAHNGKEAVEQFTLQFYDLVLMDMQMPELDGLEATRKIRALSGTQPVIIAMTANAMQEDRDQCISAGMDDYISKPINLDNLLEIIKKWSQVGLQKSSRVL